MCLFVGGTTETVSTVWLVLKVELFAPSAMFHKSIIVNHFSVTPFRRQLMPGLVPEVTQTFGFVNRII